ncbi:rab3 GTPase-activating protein regulatory subunit [Anoplophora glabripennis]|nr:rab3 GTPase-activating protein regulatory subunit [Anoplophora glabripennis]
MSCHIRLTANIQGISDIRRCLFPTDDQRGTDSWLQLCEISVSPIGDLIVIANERKIVVLSSKWDSQSSMNQFQISFSGSIHEYDKVKAVLCLPIIGQSQNSHVGPDWTCILIGYDSGFVRFYTEYCELLMEEQFHCENITTVKCQSQHSPRPDISPNLHPEQIYIQYQSNVCVINGAHLFPHLRNCCSQLARVQAKGELLQLPPLSLSPKKWGFQDQAVIHDSAVVGFNLASPFDHLLTASTCGGFETKYRAVPPHNTLVLAAGCKPFLGYHYALEGGALPVLSDVAKAVASKLKSALPGWLTGNKSQVEKQQSIAMQPAEAMGCRFGLCDLHRTATDIILSPDRKLAAVSDALGRVLLIDAFKGITLRFFKGYREAQCAFLQVPDERKSKHRIGNKVAHFLVIYSPKKGTLEVFSVQNGSKITTFTASRFSKLIYITHGLMGFTTTSKSKYICQFTTIFIDNDGQVKEIVIPFHFALAEKNNKRARDIHLYKKLRHLIKSGECDEEQLSHEIYNTCTELKTIEIKSQMVDMLLNSKDIPAEITLQCIQYFIENLVEEECNTLKTLCENASVLLKFFIFISNLPNNDHLDLENGNLKRADNTTLNLNDKELKNLQKLLDLSTINDHIKINEVHVSFSDRSGFSIAEYLSIFDLSKVDSILLKSDIDEAVLFRAAEFTFKPYITGDLVNYEELQSEIFNSKINTKNLFDLLVNYWVNRSLYINLNLTKEMNNLSSTIYALVKTAGKDIISTEYSEVSKFWSEIRDILANSSRPFPALMAAILCKQVAGKIDKELEMDDSATSLEEENMEVLSQEDIQWSLLIGKLEDISLLNIILATKPTVNECSLPKLHHDKTNISLKFVLSRGKGSISELVAQWLTSTGINPQNIINDENYRYDVSSDVKMENNSENVQTQSIKDEPICDQLNLLRKHFPYSLEASTILANMAWEYALAWRKDIQDLSILEAATTCMGFIENLQIKQGMYQLLWNTHLKIVNESASKLINKVGKLPKERLCQQDTGLSDYQISLFIRICTGFLDSFMDVAQLSYKAPKTVLQFENIWENGGQPLVELAALQREVNYNLLHLHYQLSFVLHMITTFSIKHTKPLNNLFEPSTVNLLFTDLQNRIDINWNKSDVRINTSRTQFLCKIISASLETVTENEEGSIYSKQHVNWMAKCVTLARFWNLDVDMLKRFQIVQLYSNGFDSIAEELIPAVNDSHELGMQLLTIASKRLAQFLSLSPNLSTNISALSPYLTKHLQSLDDEWCVGGSLSSITNLATYTLGCLSEKQTEYKLAQLLLEACSTLAEIQS